MGHIHTNSEYDYTASGVIVHDKKILLLFHHKLRLWLSPAGHIELHETPIEALYREVEEETGLTQEHLTLVTPYQDNLEFEREVGRNETQPMPFDIDIHPVGDEGHRHIDFGYILLSDTDSVRLEEGGAGRLEWFSLEEVEKLQPTTASIISRANYALRKVAELT